MSLLVTGSIAIDTVKTPYGRSQDCLGGSAIYFSMVASFFGPVRLLGVIGEDCPFDFAEVFKGRSVDLHGLEKRPGSKTFRWSGSYHGAMNEAETDGVELNVLAEAPPVVPDAYKDSKYVFLANTSPALQQQLLEQINGPDFVAADTMNCWIKNNLEELKQLLSRLNALVINDGEARLLTEESNLIIAAEKILEMGPNVVIIKKGEHGSMMCSKEGQIFNLPAFPSKQVKDPTGAGDSFAGAFMGYLAERDHSDFSVLKKAVAYGTVAASFTIEEFSLQGLNIISRGEIDDRFDLLRQITEF